jgi:hypothetical protein
VPAFFIFIGFTIAIAAEMQGDSESTIAKYANQRKHPELFSPWQSGDRIQCVRVCVCVCVRVHTSASLYREEER